jgi:hypothetical protein
MSDKAKIELSFLLTSAAEIESLRARLAAAEEKLHRIRRMGELSAAIMRDPERTGGWSGSERVARGFERIAHLAGEKHE